MIIDLEADFSVWQFGDGVASVWVVVGIAITISDAARL